MKVTLDIDQLLSDGQISQEEYAKLKQLASEGTASLAQNIVLALGICIQLRGAPMMSSQSASKREEGGESGSRSKLGCHASKLGKLLAGLTSATRGDHSNRWQK